MLLGLDSSQLILSGCHAVLYDFVHSIHFYCFV